MTTIRTELLADGGAAAAGDEFFRSPPFLEAEGTTHTLAAGDLGLPLIVREIPGAGGLADAVSPYGYPGGAGPGGADPAAIDFAPTGLVSIFVRERLGGAPALAGGTERSRVQVHDPELPRRLRPRLAGQIRSNERSGWKVEARAGPAAAEADLASFEDLYTATMERAGAAPRYFFDAAYLRKVLSHPRSWLLVARSPGLDAGAGAIAALSDGILHYYLGGTALPALSDSPFKNVVAAMMDLADELGTPLNLGGGIQAGDGLESFKRGFANAELPFRTHEIVCDRDAYERLSAGTAAGGFFPAYRAEP